VLIDVKSGSGSFMDTIAGARDLALMLEEVGSRCGLKLKTAVTDMNQPLGSAIGNSLEVQEAFQVLEGGTLPPPSARFKELCVSLATEALLTCGMFGGESRARAEVEQALSSGRGLEKALEWVAAQGGPSSIEAISSGLPRAPSQRELLAERTGWVATMDARRFGEGVVGLGGGRRRKSDSIDLGVGFTLDVSVGCQVKEGDRLLTIHAKDDASALAALRHVSSGVLLSDRKIEAPALFL
jgi:thymidine phosphorylase